MREAQVLESDSDSDDSGPVYGGRSDDEGAPVMSIISCGYMCFWAIVAWPGTRNMLNAGCFGRYSRRMCVRSAGAHAAPVFDVYVARIDYFPCAKRRCAS